MAHGDDLASGLLKQITTKYNEHVKENYYSGLLDFVPNETTPDDMLMIVLTDYALRNYPELLK